MDGLVLLRLILICLVPICTSIGLYFIQKYTKFNKIPFWWQQAIIGVIFGCVAIFGTEVGVDVGGAQANIRDAGPLCAGLIFGGPAGIIAGAIGGLHRCLYTVIGGKGAYTVIACSISTLLAGVYAAALRKFMFDNKRPSWGFGLAIGIVMEVIHLTILILTKLNDLTESFRIIKILGIPMILANGISVMVPCLVLSLVNRKTQSIKGRYAKLTNKIQLWMLVAVVGTFAVTTLLCYFGETNSAIINSDQLMNSTLLDVEKDISNSISDYILPKAEDFKRDFLATPDEQITNDQLRTWCLTYELDELNVVSTTARFIPNPAQDALIQRSTVDKYVGESMTMYDQPREFNCLLGPNGISWFVQEARKNAYGDGGGIIMKYCGIRVDATTYLQVGYKYENYSVKIVNKLVENVTSVRHVGQNGKIFIANKEGIIVSEGTADGRTITSLGIAGLNPSVRYQNSLKLDGVNDTLCYYRVEIADMYSVIASQTNAEVTDERDNMLYFTSFMTVIILAVLFFIIYMLVKKLVVNNIQLVNKDLGKIIDGDLDVTLKAGGSDEFVSLSNDINSTVSTLKRYIEEAAHRIDEELKFAKAIQASALPKEYPAFPNNPEIDIMAKMITAKEVGGDFYDYYLLDKNRIGFLIADVSGKGIPAAMFMMQSKATIKNYANKYTSTKDIMEHANEELCKENEAGMFVTCWFGIFELNTGLVRFTNAGHNPPIVYRKETNTWDYLKSKTGFVLSGLEGAKYVQCELQLNPGDRLFLYTDGVTEATNSNTELYGEERLLRYLRKTEGKHIEQVLDDLKKDIDNFVKDAPQFDDITMVAIKYRGKKEK